MLSIEEILKKCREDRSRQQTGAVSGPVHPEGQSGMFAGIGAEQQKYRQIAQLYEEALVLARQIYADEFFYTPEARQQLDEVCTRIVNCLALPGARESLRFCLADYPRNQEYLFYHAVNVCMLSVELLLWGKGDQQQAVELARGALLHDIGQVRFSALTNKNTRLNKEELERVRQHPLVGAEIVKTWNAGLKAEVEVISQEHERLDGSGYPTGAKDNICELARLVGLTDVYEALTHWRPYREKFSPPETLTEICRQKNAFEYKFIKSLIERFGFYPVGSCVRLNTKETAQVTGNNPSSPLRPVVQIIIDADGKELKQPRELDLSKNLIIYVAESAGQAPSRHKRQE